MNSFDANAFLKSLFSEKPPAQPKKYAKGWNEERVERTRQVCLRNKPWEHSTGPTTAEGKEKTKFNSLKHGRYSKTMQEVDRVVATVKRKNLTDLDK